jgi:hypothetical protein
MVRTLFNPLSTMSTLTPRFTPSYHHDPVNSRSEIRHCVWMAVTALTIMFQTRYSIEHKHSYKTKSIFSVVVSIAYWEFHCLSIFCRNFGLSLHFATCGFSCPALRTDCILSKNSRQTSFSAFPHHSYESFYLSVPFLLSLSCFLTFHVFVRSYSIQMHFWTQGPAVFQQVQWYVTLCAENLVRQNPV